MRPKLFRAALSRLVIRLVAFVAVAAAFFVPSAALSAVFVTAGVVALVASVVVGQGRTGRARVTAPRGFDVRTA